MFLVSDNLESRQARIRAMLNKQDAAIAVLVAAADFEWTVRRAIIALGTAPTAQVRHRLAACSGLDRYKEAWCDEIRSATGGRSHLTQVVPNWQFFKEHAYSLRNRLVHGVYGTTGLGYARVRVHSILAASRAIVNHAAERDVDLYRRPPVRRIARA